MTEDYISFLSLSRRAFCFKVLCICGSSHVAQGIMYMWLQPCGSRYYVYVAQVIWPKVICICGSSHVASMFMYKWLKVVWLKVLCICDSRNFGSRYYLPDRSAYISQCNQSSHQGGHRQPVIRTAQAEANQVHASSHRGSPSRAQATSHHSMAGSHRGSSSTGKQSYKQLLRQRGHRQRVITPGRAQATSHHIRAGTGKQSSEQQRHRQTRHRQAVIVVAEAQATRHRTSSQ